MNRSLESGWLYVRHYTRRSSLHPQILRHVSTLSAIKRGLRASDVQRRSKFRIKKEQSERMVGRVFRSAKPTQALENTPSDEPETSNLLQTHEANDGLPRSPEYHVVRARRESALRHSREETISQLLGRVKEPLLVWQKARHESQEANVHYPESAITEVRTLLAEINRNYRNGLWTTKNVQRSLKLALPDQLWSRLEEGGEYPRLHFNRPETKISLLFNEGVFDTHVDETTDDSSTRVQATHVSRNLAMAHDGKPHSQVPFARDTGGKRQRSEREITTADHDDGMSNDSAIIVPYSTAASVFLYGFNTVYAALKAGRRKFYRLHLASTNDPSVQEIRQLAAKAGISNRQQTSVAVLNKMAEYRPHNGVVLEASRIPTFPILGLGKPHHKTGGIPLEVDLSDLDYRSANQKSNLLPVALHPSRQPLVVMLDGITDPGNVGSILRTCYFYGVDAVAIATSTCANINSATLAKASSGACEAIPILALPKPSGFVYACAKSGWHILAAVAPETKAAAPGKTHLNTSGLASSSPLADKPCILMLGAEGEGLRKNLLNHADTFVTIDNGRSRNDKLDIGVESLNVSVAASVLLESLLRPTLSNEQMLAGRGSLGFGSS